MVGPSGALLRRHLWLQVFPGHGGFGPGHGRPRVSTPGRPPPQVVAQVYCADQRGWPVPAGPHTERQGHGASVLGLLVDVRV
jgi:hypothetical protein